MTTPAISQVDGTVETGQVLTITGTNMVNHDTTNWDAAFTENTSSFEGASFVADGWTIPGGYSLDSTVKLLGAKSATITDTGSGDAGVHVHGVSYKEDASQVTDATFMRMYYRMDQTVGDGSYVDSTHKLLLNYPGGAANALNLNYLTNGGGTAYAGVILLVNGSGSSSALFADGVLKDKKWYCIELEIGTPHRVWVNGVLLITWDTGGAGTGSSNWDINWNYNLASAGAGYGSKLNMDGIVLSSSRIRPASIVEIGDSATYATATKVYQYPELISETSQEIIANLAGLGAGPFYLFVTNNLGETSSGWPLGEGGGEVVTRVCVKRNS